VVPLYLDAPEKWARLMRNTLAFNGSFFNTNRMVKQYTRNAYYPVKLIERTQTGKGPLRQLKAGVNASHPIG
jgi:starch phosphorylase